MKLPIDLTKTNNGPELHSPDMSSGPRVSFHWDEKYDFPDEGIMTVRFKVRRREEDVIRGKYEEHLELCELLKVQSESAPATKGVDHGDALDQLRAKAKYEEEDED